MLVKSGRCEAILGSTHPDSGVSFPGGRADKVVISALGACERRAMLNFARQIHLS